jgi:hypothetical protein
MSSLQAEVKVYIASNHPNGRSDIRPFPPSPGPDLSSAIDPYLFP